jgi:hypothetical protein
MSDSECECQLSVAKLTGKDKAITSAAVLERCEISACGMPVTIKKSVGNVKYITSNFTNP